MVILVVFKIHYSGGAVKNEIMQNKELHKPIIRKFEKRKVHSSFIDNSWGSDLADMQLLSKCNKAIRFLLFVIDICCKYTSVIPLKDNAFRKILDESGCKPNEIWVDKGSEFYSRSMKSWLKK